MALLIAYHPQTPDQANTRLAAGFAVGRMDWKIEKKQSPGGVWGKNYKSLGFFPVKLFYYNNS